LLLVLCVLLEVVKKSQGVSMALKVLSFLFVGGAASCSKLLRCQHVDGVGEPLGDFAFRIGMTDLRCSDTTEEALRADYLGYGCAVAYGILIPSFLLYLILKQHVALAFHHRFTFWAEAAENRAVVRVNHTQPLVKDAEKEKDQMNQMASDYLLAAAIAYAAVLFRSPVPVRMTRHVESVTLERVHGRGEHEDLLELEATSILLRAAATLQHKTNMTLKRCQTITTMLSEREMLEREATSDRIVAGAKTIFFKYAAGENVWVEAAQKGIAVALVITVSLNSLLVTLFVTVGYAILLGAQKPYRQRQ
ncbi:unnamed protein product, partial [Symbiodinium pilosum]